LLHLVIHPDGNIWMVGCGGKLGIALARDVGQPVTMPDEKAEVVATCTVRGREDAPAAPRHASLIVFVEIDCFRSCLSPRFSGRLALI
jgi:hypothetical protein